MRRSTVDLVLTTTGSTPTVRRVETTGWRDNNRTHQPCRIDAVTLEEAISFDEPTWLTEGSNPVGRRRLACEI